jgi:hypothetical protein
MDLDGDHHGYNLNQNYGRSDMSPFWQIEPAAVDSGVWTPGANRSGDERKPRTEQRAATAEVNGGYQVQANEAVQKKEEAVMGVQSVPTWAMYAEAMNKFRRSASAFMEHVHLLTEARAAYQEAISVGTELRKRLDVGDDTLSSLMGQLEQVVNVHLSEPVPDRKKPELVKGEASKGKSENAEATFP